MRTLIVNRLKIVNSTPDILKITNPTIKTDSVALSISLPDASRPVGHQPSWICRRGSRRARESVAHFTAHFNVSLQVSPKSSCCVTPVCVQTRCLLFESEQSVLKARFVTWWENTGAEFSLSVLPPCIPLLIAVFTNYIICLPRIAQCDPKGTGRLI